MYGRGEEAGAKVNRTERGELNEELIADGDVRMFSFKVKKCEGGWKGRQDAIEVDGPREGVDQVKMQ
jgi:hypothetical protein